MERPKNLLLLLLVRLLSQLPLPLLRLLPPPPLLLPSVCNKNRFISGKSRSQ